MVLLIIDALGRNLLLAPLVSHTNGVAITSIVTVVLVGTTLNVAAATSVIGTVINLADRQ